MGLMRNHYKTYIITDVLGRKFPFCEKPFILQKGISSMEALL